MSRSLCYRANHLGDGAMKLSPTQQEARTASQIALAIREADNKAGKPLDANLRLLVTGKRVRVNGWKRAKGR